MAKIKPFKALRPHPDKVRLVASVPYDVVNREEALLLAGNNPYSFLRVTRAEIEFEQTINPYSDEVYQKAKVNLDNLKKEAFIQEETPSFYIYQLAMNGRTQKGIAASFSTQDYDNNIIMKHEKTRKEKEDDRTKHILTTRAQTGPVFLTYNSTNEIDQIVDNITKNEESLYSFTTDDGIKHTIWKVSQSFNSKIIKNFERIGRLYIADGHHRAAGAGRAAKVIEDRNLNKSDEEDYKFFLGVIFPAEQLKILPYNRVIYDLNGLNKSDFLDLAGEKFTVEKTNDPSPKQKTHFGLYIKKQWYLLRAKDKILASNSLSPSVGDKLDVSILQNFLLNPILEIGDPRTDRRIDFIGGIRGASELENLVDSGKAAAAFSMFPVSIDDLIEISNAGEVMPPKSTWFEPKLRDGLLVHLI